MEWHRADLQNLAIIDQQIGDHQFSAAEYEIVRQVIQATADYEYQKVLQFSDLALQSGAGAIANRLPIIVDTPTVMAGIMPTLLATFANPVFCATETLTRPQQHRSNIAWGMEALLKRYPEAIAVVGESHAALETTLSLVDAAEIAPSLIVGVPSSFHPSQQGKAKLGKSLTEHIFTQGIKGNALVAIAIVNVLVSLAWEAQGIYKLN
ncbi:MAG: precorrin-8X methylmutase [Pseudanabaenaceae cyanobacterium bins.68]|nr:precorrin-8X methylmutase [Pseudanabaenaceae cyanobacterium bins.68]